MAFKGFGDLPGTAEASTITNFHIDIPDEDIRRLKQLLNLTHVANANYENSRPVGGRNLGLRRDWLIEAKHTWENDFDWRRHEAHMNSFPNFKAVIKDDLGDFSIHFVALFSKKEDAVPLFFFHGWPGNFAEFLHILELLGSRYTPDTLPYHVIVPSLPGYTFSSPPPEDHDFGLTDVARLMDKLAKCLGFGGRYVVQGGDVGSRVARIMAATYDGCKAIHCKQSTGLCLVLE